MKNQRNSVGSQAAIKEKSIDNTIRDLVVCDDLAAGLAAIARLAQRQQEAPSKSVLRVALDCVEWKTPALLPAFVEALLPHTDPNAVFGKGKTALMLAVERCVMASLTPTHPAEIETLRRLAAVCNGHATDEREQTALMLAAKGRVDQSVFDILLPISDARAQDRFGRTALLLAAEARLAENVERLLPHSDPNAVDEKGRTALHVATLRYRSSRGLHRRAFELLLPCTTAKISGVWAMFRDGPCVVFLGHDEWTRAADEVLCHPGLSLRQVKNGVARHQRFDLPNAKARLAANEAKQIAAAFDESRNKQRGRHETEAPAIATATPTRPARAVRRL